MIKIRSNDLYTFYIQVLTEDEVDVITKFDERYSGVNGNLLKAVELKDKIAKEFNKVYPNIDFPNIITYGNTSLITNNILGEFIDSCKVSHKLGGGQQTDTKAFRCFSSNSYSDAEKLTSIIGFTRGNLIMHEDRLSAWNCLMERLMKPKYVIVFKIEK